MCRFIIAVVVASLWLLPVQAQALSQQTAGDAGSKMAPTPGGATANTMQGDAADGSQHSGSTVLQGGAEQDAVAFPPSATEPVQQQGAPRLYPWMQRSAMSGSAQQAGAPMYGSAMENGGGAFAGAALMFAPPMVPQMARPPVMYGQTSQQQYAAALDPRGTPVLPKWKSQPDEVIGHFGIDYMGVRIRDINGPPSQRVDFQRYQKWRGFKHSPCFIWLTPVVDGSGGYFFHCMESQFGPRGWIYPLPKGVLDKVTPWAIFFDQP
jgi:hypothetical protein